MPSEHYPAMVDVCTREGIFTIDSDVISIALLSASADKAFDSSTREFRAQVLQKVSDGCSVLRAHA